MSLSDYDLLVLREIYIGEKNMRDIAESVNKSLGTIQAICKKLERNGYVMNPYDSKTGEGRKARGRIVTGKGIDILKKANLIVGDNRE